MKRHPLLERQLKKFAPAGEDPGDEKWKRFLAAVDEAYCSFDDDRKMLEHSMDLSSEEMIKNEHEIRAALVHLQETQAQLIHSEKLASLGQLAAGIAHEINNPASFVSGNLQALDSYMSDCLKILALTEELLVVVEQKDMEKAQALLSRMRQMKEAVNLEYMMKDIPVLLQETQNGLERIIKIVSDLRTFSREDKGVLIRTSIETVIDGALNIIHNEIKFTADIEKKYAAGLPLVKCSEQKLSQVFMNLIMNAVQAMKERGTITIKTFQDGEYICASIRDTGPGIPADVLSKIFDPFFTTKPVGKGTGLGLSISHEIIKNHGGDIKVSSTIGEGTTFTVMLPNNK